jgi:hypothetical protein
MIHLRMKYFQQQKKTYQWGRGVAVMREDLFKMLDFLEEAVLICQVDKESTKKHLVLLADFLEQNYDWDPSSFSVHDLADRVDDFFLHTARVKDILATKAKIIEPYELYKAMNEVKAHKEVLICVMMSRLVNHAFSTVMPKTVSYQELYEEENGGLQKNREAPGRECGRFAKGRGGRAPRLWRRRRRRRF